MANISVELTEDELVMLLDCMVLHAKHCFVDPKFYDLISRLEEVERKLLTVNKGAI